MLLAIDIGNTNIKIALFRMNETQPLFRFAISSNCKRTPDEYELLFKHVLREKSLGFPTASVITSVVPSVTEDIYKAVRSMIGADPFIIGSGTRTGFQIKIDVLSQLGADIVANTAAAAHLVKPPFVIVDVGTATTFTAVNSEGQLVGTAIAPGATVSLDALSRVGAQLTDVSFGKPQSVIGKNSKDSIKSGAFYGHVCMIDGFVSRLRDELCKNGEKLNFLGTGGLSADILAECSDNYLIEPDLTLIGSAVLYYHNTKNRRSNYTK